VCGFIDVEGTFDKPWAARVGVDLLKLMLSQPEAAEQSLDIADALVRSCECDVMVLDSIAFLTPSKEISNSTEQETMGQQPRIVGKGVRKFVSGLNAVALHSERRPTIFLTNQIRMKIGVVFGNPETSPGGLAPGFASSVELKMKGGKFEFEKLTKEEETAGKDRAVLEVELNFDVEKNKVDVAKRSGSFRLVLVDGETKKKGDVYDEDVLMEAAEEYGLIKKGGKGWDCLGESFTAKSHVEKKLLTDPLFSQHLRTAALQVILATDRAWAEVDEPSADPLPPPETPTEERVEK
jgi:recombination protein RecA